MNLLFAGWTVEKLLSVLAVVGAGSGLGTLITQKLQQLGVVPKTSEAKPKAEHTAADKALVAEAKAELAAHIKGLQKVHDEL